MFTDLLLSSLKSELCELQGATQISHYTRGLAGIMQEVPLHNPLPPTTPSPSAGLREATEKKANDRSENIENLVTLAAFSFS